MRRIFALILAALLLVGCTTAQPVHTTPSPMDGGEPVGQYGNLWYLPNETVDAMEVRQLLGTGDGLLLCSGDGTLVLLDQEDLTVRAQTVLSSSDRAIVQVLDAGISVADPGNGTVTVLDAALTASDVYSLEPAEDTWLMGMDGENCYVLSNAGICAVRVSSGQSQMLLQTQRLSPIAMNRDRIYLAAVGTSDLVTRWFVLDLSADTVSELDASGKLALKQGLVPADRECWLEIENRELTLYSADGSYLSSCELPGGEKDRTGADYIWSERWQGWFFLDRCRSERRLMFWDPAVPTEGEPVDLAPETVPEGRLLDRELYDRAERLSEQYGLDIRIADRCIRDYTNYAAGELTDPELTAQALSVLESALACYPEGFFRQLGFSDVETIRIEMVDDLKVKADADDAKQTSAFAQERDGYYLLVFNAERIQKKMVFHEISHIIDKRLAWDAKLREDALYSEDRWMALQPEGFAYAGSYTDIPDSVKKYYDSGFFVRDYSCVSASEDRAMLMEKAMLGEKEVFDANPHLMPKLRYYCDCIRDSFDTTGWPEVTFWEKLLDTAG